MATKSAKKDSTATIGFDAKPWLTADKLRNNMDAAEYKHVVLGLIFLKYISDTFEEHRAKLLAGQGDYAGANAEDPDEYKAENVFWVPMEARWPHLRASAVNQRAKLSRLGVETASNSFHLRVSSSGVLSGGYLECITWILLSRFVDAIRFINKAFPRLRVSLGYQGPPSASI